MGRKHAKVRQRNLSRAAQRALGTKRDKPLPRK